MNVVIYKPTGPRRGRHKARLRAGDVEIVMPFAPTDVEHTPRQRAWSEQGRPGRSPLLLEDGTTLASMRWTPLVALADIETPIEGLIDRLERLAAGKDRVRVLGMSRRERGPWVLGATYTVLARQEGTNAITRARFNLTFTEPSTANPKLGPVNGGKNGGHHGGGGVRHYVVKKGDTLRAIANRFYGDPSKWTLIAKANRIKNPARLRVGQRLTIPPKGGK